MKSNTTSKASRSKGIVEVVNPRGVTYSVTFHQWFTSGVRPARVLPTICVHMCSVSQVLSHSANGSGGHSSEIKFDLVDIAPAPIFARLERFDNRVLGRVKMLGGVLVFR